MEAQRPETHEATSLKCGTADTPDENLLKIIKTAQSERSSRLANENLREVRLAVVIDSTIYYAYNRDTNAIKETLYRTIRRASQTIFEPQLNIRLNVSYLEFSLKDRRYNSLDGSFEPFRKFQNEYAYRREIKRDVMMLWSVLKGEEYSGVAGFLGLYPNALTAIHCTTSDSDKNPFTHLFAHELGHALGSPHSHSCLWPGGPFDVCFNPEGDCPSAVASRWGSTMSYCQGGGYLHPLSVDVIQKSSYIYLDPMSEKPLEVPSLYFPENERQAFYPSTFFSWAAMTRISSYQVQISENPGFNTTILDTLVHENTFYPEKSLKRNTIYYWRVRGINQLGSGEWSIVSWFRTHLAPVSDAPSINPIDETRTGGDELLSFKPVNDANEYEIQFVDYTYSNVTAQKRIKTTSFLLKEMTTWQNGQYWRVRAINDEGAGRWSSYQSVYYFPKTQLQSYKIPVGISVPLLFKDRLPTTDKNWFRAEFLERTYRLQVSADDKFANLMKDLKFSYNYKGDFAYGDLNPALLIDYLVPERQYYYRYKVKSSLDSSEWITSDFKTSWETRWKTMYYHDIRNYLFNSTLYGIFTDKQNNRWAYGKGPVVMIAADNYSSRHFYPATGWWQDINPSSEVTAMGQDGTGRIWIGTSSGITTFENYYFKSYPSTLWSPFVNDGSVKKLVVSNKEIVYFSTSGRNLFKYDGKQWTNIAPGLNVSSSAEIDLKTDKEGNLWAIAKQFFNCKIWIYDGVKWTEYPQLSELLNNRNGYLPLLDEEGNIYVIKEDKLIIIKDKSGNYETIDLRSIHAMDDLNGKMISIDLYPSFFLSAVSKSGKTTYFSFNYQGRQILLERSDDQRWKLRQFYGGLGSIIHGQMAVDGNKNVTAILGNKVIETFNPGAFTTELQTKIVGKGCTINFRVGIIEPPRGNAEQNNLKAYLSDSSSTTFRQIPATYNNGEVRLFLPANLHGKGFRFKYTLGDNWLESNESDPFDISESIIITGPSYFCSGESTAIYLKGMSGAEKLNYQWILDGQKIGPDSPYLTISRPGNYSVTAKDETGCTVSSEVINVVRREINTKITPENPDVIYRPNTLLLSAAKIDSATYQWMNGNTKIEGATQHTFEAKESGSYFVRIASQGCADVSNPVKVRIESPLSSESEPSPDSFGLTISPNPTPGKIEVKTSGLRYSSGTIRLIDFSGKKLKEWHLDRNEKMLIDLSGLPAGVYLIKASNKNEEIVKKIVKE